MRVPCTVGSFTCLDLTRQRQFTLETCCGYGYGPARDLHLLPRIFKGRRELTGRRRNRAAFQGMGPYLGTNPFQGALPFTKKRELFPGPPPASPGSFALPHWTPRGARLRHSGFWDLNLFSNFKWVRSPARWLGAWAWNASRLVGHFW